MDLTDLETAVLLAEGVAADKSRTLNDRIATVLLARTAVHNQAQRAADLGEALDAFAPLSVRVDTLCADLLRQVKFKLDMNNIILT